MGADLVGDFCTLFRGRLDAYGTDAGGCEWVDFPMIDGVGRDPDFGYDEWRRRMALHLTGAEPFGVYPRTDEGVYWGCTDLDKVSSPAAAKNIARTLSALGLNAWIELTRSGNGYHVWSFAHEWVPAETMRNAFLAVHQLLGIRPTEVNPKSVHGGKTGIGNYVRVPYPGAIGGSPIKNQAVYHLESGVALYPNVFVSEALKSRSSRLDYEKVASRYTPPQRRDVAIDTLVSDLDVTARGLNGPGFFAFKYGPRDGHDRSDSLARLAHNCRESGLSPSEAFAIILDADSRWGKFSERADCHDQITRLVENAYG